MKRTVININELPLPSQKIYRLIQDVTNGNIKSFAESINVSQQSLNRIFCIDKRNGKYPSVSDDIKNGIIKTYGKNEIWFITDNMNESAIKEDAAPPKDNYRLVPIIHIDSVGGMHSQNSIVQEPQYIEGYAPFAGAKEGDVCIIQSGDSMIPTCPAGSLLLVRQVLDWREYFGYGNIFVLVLTDGRRITKEVTKYAPDPQNYVWCVSHNPDVPDEERPKSMIAAVWKVIKILVNKGW